MNNFTCYLVFLAAIAICQVQASNEILNILNTANDLTLREVNALRPLFNELQKQYDAISSALANEGSSFMVPWQKEGTPETDIEDYINSMEAVLVRPALEKANTLKYDTKLPTFEELVDEAQTGIDELVQRALHVESEMLKLNKPKIVMYIYAALSVLFRYSAQLRRAAYCVYSHVPELNDSMQHLNAGVECYGYTKNLIGKVEQEVVHTVGTIKKNVLDLAKVYRKIAEKHSVVGKIVTAVLQVFRITRDVRETLTVTTKAIDGLENKLPNAALQTVECGQDFVGTLPFMLETAFNVTTCITYVEPMTEEYEFLLPESERNFKLDDSK